MPWCAAACKRSHVALRADRADAMIAGVGDEERPVRAQGDAVPVRVRWGWEASTGPRLEPLSALPRGWVRARAGIGKGKWYWAGKGRGE